MVSAWRCSLASGEPPRWTSARAARADLDLRTRRDLADIRQTGALNKDEFAVALKLIRDKVAGKELPQTLGAGLMPPSLRGESSSSLDKHSRVQLTHVLPR